MARVFTMLRAAVVHFLVGAILVRLLAGLLLLAPASVALAQNYNAIAFPQGVQGNTWFWDLSAARAVEQAVLDKGYPYPAPTCQPKGWKADPTHWYTWNPAQPQSAGRNAYVEDEYCGIFGWYYNVGSDEEYYCGAGWRWDGPGGQECVAGYYIVIPENPLPAGDCTCNGNTGRVTVGEPIEVATGNVSLAETDFTASDPRLRFSRSYNSNSTIQTVTGIGWRSFFDRNISSIESGFPRPLPGVSVASPTYSSAGDACTKGAAFIANNNPKYASVTGSYDGAGHCDLSTGEVIAVLGTGTGVGYSSSSDPASRGITVRREDGSQYFFFCSQGVCHPNSNVAIKLALDSSGYQLTDVDGTVEHYDPNGVLQTITWQDNYQESLLYNGDGTLHSITDSKGRSISLAYDTNSLLASITIPDQTIIQYAHDPDGRLTSVTYPDGTRTYQYTDTSFPDALTAIVDENTKIFTSWQYDSSGRAYSSEHAGGADAVSLTFNGDGSVGVTDALGAQRTYTFTSFEGMQQISTTDGPVCTDCGAGAINTYDSNGYLSGSEDWNHNDTAYTFDSSGLETQQVDAQGSPVERTINTQWDDVLRNPLDRQVLDVNGNLTVKTDWLYNPRGQVLARCEDDPTVSGATSYVCSNSGTPPAGVRRWTYTYCDVVDGGQCPLIGLLLSADGPRADVSDVTQYSYYSTTDESGCGTPGGACHRVGDLDKVTDALGQVTETIAYDKNGRIVRSKDANGVLTDFTYTQRGWLHTRTVRANADGSPSSQDATTTIDYYPVGTVEQVTQPDGVYTHYDYDDAHRLTQITDAQGNYIKYTLDAAGNRREEDTYAAGGSTPSRTLSRHFNTLDQQDQDSDAYNNTTHYQYDPNGNRTDATDRNTITTHSNYDALNRLSQTIQNYNGTDPATQSTTTGYGYDSHDNLTQVTDPNTLNTNYTYDGLDDLSQLQSPDTGTTHYTFDASGNRITQTDAKSVLATYTYDALNRLTAISYPTSSLNVNYYYDEPNSTTGCASSYPIGRLTRMTDSSGSTTYCYDQRGNVITKSALIGAVPANTRYVYNLADRLMEVDYPGNDADIVYTRDADGRIASVSNGTLPIVTAISYLPFGPANQYTYAGGQTLAKTYDANYRATDITGSAINLHFTRDALGNINEEGDAAGVPTPNESYLYDPLNRLQEVDNATGASWQHYAYSRTGDRLTKNTAGITPVDVYHYTSGTHHLSSITGSDASARAFDANGNTTALQANGWTYGLGYNNTNRLSLVQQNGTTIMQYKLDGKGERVRKVPSSGTATEYAYDEPGKLLYEYVGPNTNRSYIWADETLIATVEAASSIHYVYTDHLGTPRAVTNTTSGAPIWTWPWTQNPFGERPASGSGYTLNVRYPGQYYDSETGLHYNYLRDYEPATGRYGQSDPIGLLGGVGTYGFVLSAPFSWRDPLGLDVVALFNQNAANVFGVNMGHAAVAVGNDNGTGWDYYAKNGIENGHQVDVAIHYNTLQDFENANGDQFTLQLRMKSNAGRDAAMRAWAKKHLRDQYSGLSNNCGDFVNGILAAGGFNTNPNWIMPTIPNDMYDYIQGNNHVDYVIPPNPHLPDYGREPSF